MRIKLGRKMVTQRFQDVRQSNYTVYDNNVREESNIHPVDPLDYTINMPLVVLAFITPIIALGLIALGLFIIQTIAT